MATPLTDSINALTAYANEVTGGSDTTLSDAVHTLASGYGKSVCKVSEVKLSERGTSLSVPVESRPWAFILWRDSDGGLAGYTGRVVTRLTGMWTLYNGGTYAGGRACVSGNSSNPDHYSYTGISYDDTTKTLNFTGTQMFSSDLPYTLIYMTAPSAT